MNKESNDGNNSATFEFVIKSKNRKIKLGIKWHKKRVSEKCMRKEKEKEAK